MKNIKHKKVPNCLRKYRRVRGFSQKDVSEILGFSNTSMLSRWEKGRCLPNSMNVFRLALLYRTMVDALYIDLIRSLREEIHKSEDVFKEKQGKDD